MIVARTNGSAPKRRRWCDDCGAHHTEEFRGGKWVRVDETMSARLVIDPTETSPGQAMQALTAQLLREIKAADKLPAVDPSGWSGRGRRLADGRVEVTVTAATKDRKR